MPKRFWHFFLTVLCVVPIANYAQEKSKSDSLSRLPTHLSDMKDSVLNPDMFITDSIQPDTTERKMPPIEFRTSNSLEEIIDSDALDSIVSNMREEKTFLYNKAVVIYGDIKLEAGYMEIDMKINEVLATGFYDSTGALVQKPVFTEGGKEYRTDTIRYNFDTGKAIIKQLLTQEGEAFMQGERAKKMDDDVMYINRASYTTCSHETPHFRIMTTKTKVIPNERLVTGPAYLEVLELPTPLALPFGFFPTMEERKSGILIPAYGSSLERGHFLRGGGFYLSISDYWDYTIRTDIFTRGGYGLFNTVNYAQRYKFKGNVNLDYNRIIIGRPEFDAFNAYQNSSDFSIRWSHQQDPKANPNLQFSANVNIATQSFNQLATQDPNSFLSNQLNSSVNLTKSFPSRPFTLGVQAGHDQSNATGNLNLNLPTVNFNMNRIFPFKRSMAVGKDLWYEKIMVQYTGNFQNRIETTLDEFEVSPQFLADNSKSGVRHNVPISASYKVFKFFTLAPSVNYSQQWFFSRNEFRHNPDRPAIDSVTGRPLMQVDTIRESGFFTPQTFNVRADLTTKIYGMWNYKKGPLKALRHVLTPLVGLSYSPDFSDPFWGSYQEVQINPEGETQRLTQYGQNTFAGPGAGRQGNVNFRLDNVVEAKMRSKRDTTGERKIKLLEGFTINGSYNMAAEQFQWSQVRITARSSILKGLISFNYNTAFDPYGLDENGQRINEFYLNTDGRLLRPVNSQFNVTTNLSSKTFDFLKSGKENPAKQPVGNGYDPLNVESGFGAYTTGDPNYFHLNYFVDYTATWNLTLNYVASTQFVNDEARLTQTFDFRGDISLTQSWRIGFSSGYDLQNNGFSYTSLDFYKDLHCWELNCRWIPFGVQQSYFLSLGVKAPMFKDLKLERQRGIGDFGQRL
ncbi:MAG: LPS-assembly protein LptD [Cryomorphaceae bacterium]|nr:LPS-assembly protein LptD [Cryomorphaceae bacterium]